MDKIFLYWWSEIFIQKKSKENYGDVLGKYLVEKISGKTVVWHNPKKKQFSLFKKPVIYATIGSILAHIKDGWVVWGSGIIAKDSKVAKGKFLAVRGPKTREHLLQMGYEVPEIYGDPGLLLPDFYHPEIAKTFEIGIIPHYNDYALVKQLYASNANVAIIDLMTNDIEATTNLILACKQIVSSSLHGIIMSHAYRIPAVWIQFSDKVFGDGVKYQDYFESVGIPHYVPQVYTNTLSVAQCIEYINGLPNLPEETVVTNLKKGLMQVCPFVN